MQRPSRGPHAMLLRQLHGRRPQVPRNALISFAVTLPVFKFQLCFLNCGRNRDVRSLTHQHALLLKWHAEAISPRYANSLTPAERTHYTEHRNTEHRSSRAIGGNLDEKSI